MSKKGPSRAERHITPQMSMSCDALKRGRITPGLVPRLGTGRYFYTTSDVMKQHKILILKNLCKGASTLSKLNTWLVIPAKAGIQNRLQNGFRIKCGMTTYVIEVDRLLLDAKNLEPLLGFALAEPLTFCRRLSRRPLAIELFLDLRPKGVRLDCCRAPCMRRLL